MGQTTRCIVRRQVFYTNAPSYWDACLFRRHKLEKKREYEDRIRNVDCESFIPLVFSTFGSLGKRIGGYYFYNRLADLLSQKHNTLSQCISGVQRSQVVNLLSCISTSGDPQLQQLGLQLHLGDAYLQTQASDYQLLSKAHLQLSSFPMARPLYLLSKKLLAADECYRYDDHLDTLSVQCKLNDSVCLESCWNRVSSWSPFLYPASCF